MTKKISIFGVIIVATMIVIFAIQGNWTAVAALAALAAVIIAVYQSILSRMTMGADLLMRLENRFEEEDFFGQREKAALALRAVTKENKGDIEDVLDFFETIGLLVKKEALDPELAWNSFFYWLHGYYRWAKSFIEQQQKAFPNRYRELVWLHEKLIAIEKDKGLMNETEWDEFLDEEGALLSK